MKTNQIKKWTIGVLTSSLLASSFISVSNISAAVEPIIVNAKAAFVIDSETNKILFDQNGNESLGIASMTKMLSVYILLEAIENGEISWDTAVPVSDYAYLISQNYGLSNVPLRQDFTYNVRDMYEAMLIYSANGASIAVAELVAGSEPAFVDMMTAKLDEWGMSDYQIFNSSGLPNSYANDLGYMYPEAPIDIENHMTARDVAYLADRLIEDFPEVLETTSIVSKVFMEGSGDEIQMSTYNWMLPEMPYYRPGLDGLKTGTNDDSGASFTGTAVENDMRIITVVIGTADNDDRFLETGRLMDFAFDNFEKVQLIESGTPVETEDNLPVASGKEEEVPLIYSGDLTVVTPNQEEREIQTELSLNQNLLNDDGLVEAPIEANTEVGNVAISIEGDDLGYLDGETNNVSVAVAETVEKASFFTLAWRWTANTATDAWNSITDFITGFFN